VLPDREITPKTIEVKKVYQNISVKPVDLIKGKVKIVNKYFFTNLNEFILNWQLKEDNKIICQGSDPNFSLEPRNERVIALPIKYPAAKAGAEYWLNFSFILKKDMSWADKGYEIAKEQLPIPLSKPITKLSPAKLHNVKVEETSDRISVTGNNFKVSFDKAKGIIDTYSFNNIKLIQQGPQPNFWRAPTDNDFGNNMQERCAVWKYAGVNREVKSVTLLNGNDLTKNIGSNKVIIKIESLLKGAGSKYITIYTIYGNGDILIDNSFTPGKKDLPELPRFGMNMVMPKEFSNVQFYGRGPQENYCDRKTAAFVDLYKLTVDEMYTNYVSPQENGTRTDLRWIALSNSNGTGLLAIGEPLLSASALYYTDLDLTQKDRGTMHPTDLVNENFISVNLDLIQMGVGGDNSWGAKTHPQYMIFPECYSYKFLLRPFDKNNDLMSLSKKLYY